MAGSTPPAMSTRWSRAGLPTIVGREHELMSLEDAWSDACRGERRSVFIGGEPGAGKSRLLTEMASRRAQEGATVLYGACVQEFGPPYQPFIEPVDALHDLVAADVEHSPADGAPLLARLTTVSGRRDARTQAADVEREYQRELYDAVVEAVRTVARDRPVLLALEDLQWAGSAALTLLSHLVERTAGSRLLVVATQRTTAPDRSPELVRTIAQLYRLEGVDRLDLAGLSTDAVTRYLAEAAGVPEAGARAPAAVLRDQTGGNPFFLRELWRDLSSRGGLAAMRSWQLTAPQSVRDALEARLDRLAAPHRQVLELAAVIGTRLHLGTLLAAGEWTAQTTMQAVDEAASFGLLETSTTTEGHLRFPHALARQTVLDLMGPTRRVTEHARVAEALERSTTDPPVEQLAYHYASARALGYGDKAVHYVLAAARQADAGLAHQDAARWFERAASLSEDAEQRELHRLAAARSHLLGGDFARARELFEQVSLGATDPKARVQAAVGFEAASWRPGRPGHRAVELLSDALEGVPPDESDPGYVRALASLGRALAFTGATEQAGSVGVRAVELARATGDDRLLADALQASLWLGLRPHDAAAKLERATELAQLADRTGELGHLGVAAYYRGVIAYLRGDPVGWDEAHTELLRSARVSGQTFFAYMAACLDYGRQLVSGQFPAAERGCAELARLGESFGSDDTEGSYGVQMFMLRRETGGLEQVRGLVHGDEKPTDHWAPGLLALYTELGLREPAERLLRWLLDEDLMRHRDSAQWPAVLAFLTEAALELEDADVAARLRPLIAEYEGMNLVAGQFVALFGSADRYLGSVDSLLGTGDPEAHFAAAQEMDDRMGATASLAHSLAAWAAHLHRVGADANRIAELVDRSRSLARTLGLHRVHAVLDRLPPTGVPQPRPAPGAAPDGLTRRETEVLRLVGIGLSNRDIAGRLVISENTAANHVRSILAKTGCGNRTQAAHYASQRGLLA